MNRGTRRQGVMIGIALLGLLACAWCARVTATPVLLSYLAAYVFFLGLALGSMALLMVHVLTGGAWGLVLRAPLLAGMSLLPLLAVLLLPLLLGSHALYPWLRDGAASFSRQRWYLNALFFVGRAIVCFALWLSLMRGLRRRLDDPSTSKDLQRFAAIGMIVYALSISIAAVDWIMSLVPAWHSTVFGLIVATSQLVIAASMAIFRASAREDVAPEAWRDLGNLLLMLVLAWSYLAFMDYLTAWIADLPADTVWYLPRLRSSWHWLGVTLVVIGLALPFAVLLSRRAKAQRTCLRAVASTLLIAQVLFALWLVLPSFRPRGFALTLPDLFAWMGIGGLCLAWFERQIGSVHAGSPR